MDLLNTSATQQSLSVVVPVWNEEGVILVGTLGVGLRQVSASGGAPAAMTTLPASARDHQFPQFLPGGRQFLYLERARDPERVQRAGRVHAE